MIEYYWLKNGIHACIDKGFVIFLDTFSDQYYALDPRDACIAVQHMHTVPAVSRQFNSSTISPPNITTVLGKLLSAGLITPSISEGRQFEPIKIQPPSSPFEQIEIEAWPSIRPQHVISCLLSGIAAAYLLKFCSLRTILQILSHIKYTKRKQSAQKAIYLAQIYRFTRTLLPKDRICFYDSITFVIFCRIFGISPDLIFAVTSDPFQAHCWVQYDGIILNDAPQRTNRYTPIMSI